MSNNLVSCSLITVRPLPSNACNAIVSSKVKARLVTLSCYHSVNSKQQPSASVKTPYYISKVRIILIPEHQPLWCLDVHCFKCASQYRVLIHEDPPQGRHSGQVNELHAEKSRHMLLASATITQVETESLSVCVLKTLVA